MARRYRTRYPRVEVRETPPPPKPSIDLTKFYRPHDKGHGPARNIEDFFSYQIQHNREKHEPIPIRQGEKHDWKNPVWNSAAELVNYARQIPGWSVYGSRSDEDSMSDDWSWNHNMADVFELYDRGWSEGFEAVKAGMENAARVAMAAMEETQTLERHVSGSFVDVPAYLRGEPESMYEFEQRIVDVLKVTVELDGFIVCTTDADEIMYRGVAVMSAIMALRRLGIFVDLVHVMRGTARCFNNQKDHRPSARKLSVTTHLMNSGIIENLSETLLFICHPAFYRTIYFHAICSAWGCMEYGICNQDYDSQDYFPKPGSGRIVIPGNFRPPKDDSTGIDWGNSWTSPKAAELMVKQMLECAAPTNR